MLPEPVRVEAVSRHSPLRAHGKAKPENTEWLLSRSLPQNTRLAGKTGGVPRIRGTTKAAWGSSQKSGLDRGEGNSKMCGMLEILALVVWSGRCSSGPALQHPHSSPTFSSPRASCLTLLYLICIKASARLLQVAGRSLAWQPRLCWKGLQPWSIPLEGQPSVTWPDLDYSDLNGNSSGWPWAGRVSELPLTNHWVTLQAQTVSPVSLIYNMHRG